MAGNIGAAALTTGYASEVMPARVEFENRPRSDLVCFLIFVIMLICHVVLGIVMVLKQNVSFNEQGAEFSGSLIQEQSECYARTYGANNNNRLLIAQQNDLWSLMAENPQIPAVTIAVVPVIAVMWMGALYMFSFTMAWFSIIINCGMYVSIGVAILMEELDTAIGALFMAFGIILLLLAIYSRALVRQSADNLKMATLILSKLKSVFLAGGIVQALLLAFMGLTFWFWISAAKVWEVQPIGCRLAPVDAYGTMTYFAIYLVWFCCFMDGIKMVVTAMSVGTGFFDQSDRPRGMYPLTALKIVASRSVGTVAAGSLIAAIVENIIQRATKRFWFLDPVSCILKLILLIFQSCIMALTRFALVAHAFTGLGFFGSSKRVFKVMKKNFAGAYVNDRVGVSVVRTGAHVFSILIGLAAWYWIDHVKGWDTLQVIGDLFRESFFMALLMIAVYVWLSANALFTICVIVLLQETVVSWADTGPEFNGPILGIFITCISSIILNFQGDIILNALDTTFLCHAIGKDNNIGKPSSGDRAMMYVLLEEVPEAKQVTPS